MNLVDYKTTKITSLVDLANNNDELAQQEVIDRYFNGYYIGFSIKPLEWIGFIEKAYQNSKYMYFFLVHYKNSDFIGDELFVNLYNHIKKNENNDNDEYSLVNMGLIYNMWYTHYDLVQQIFNGPLKHKFIHESPNNRLTICDKCMMLYTKSANQNNKYSMYNLATFLLMSIESLPNPIIESFRNTIVNIFTKVAKQGQGDVLSEIFLAMNYHTGFMITINYDGNHIISSECNESVIDHNKALYWYKKAADHNHPSGIFGLGILYENGTDTVRDVSKAIECYVRLKNENFPNSKNILPEIFEKKIIQSQKNIVLEDIESLESDLLAKWQYLLITIKYEKLVQEESISEILQQILQKIENIIYQIIKWRHEINSRDNILLGCINFMCLQSAQSIQEKQKISGEIPFVKQHKLCNKYYVTFGHDNVKLVDSIIEAIRCKKIQKQVIELIDQFKSQLTNICIESTTIFEILESSVEKFNNYYQLFINNIRYNQHNRNNKFMEHYW